MVSRSYYGAQNATPEIPKKVRSTAGKNDFDIIVRPLTSFLQSDVRYVAVEIGIGGYQPHAANDVFRARYGDCKDKAMLLSSMLQEAGIASDYVVISTYRGTVDPTVPSAESFNHVILAIELPNGVSSESYPSTITSKAGQRYLIFDPTDEYTPLGELRAALQDTHALLVTNSGGELIHTPLLPPETNLLSRSGHFTLDPEGTLTGEVTETRSGDHASHERALLLEANQQERAQHLERELNQSLKGFTLESSNIEQLDQLQNNLVLTLKLAAPQYGQLRGILMLVRPRVLEEKGFEVESKPRQYAFVLGRASRETDSYEIDLPQGYTVDDVPDPVKLDMGFASYQSKMRRTDFATGVSISCATCVLTRTVSRISASWKELSERMKTPWSFSGVCNKRPVESSTRNRSCNQLVAGQFEFRFRLFRTSPKTTPRAAPMATQTGMLCSATPSAAPAPTPRATPTPM